MPRADETLAAAEAGDRVAIESVLKSVHPAVHRVARELTGDEGRAEATVNGVFGAALRALPQWSTWTDPQNWFLHQTLQAARRAAQGRPPAADDALTLALPPEKRSPAYLALVRGVRRLPPQQAEAFVLHHGESLNARLLGVSMDCSTQAAETHLKAAETALRQLVDADEWAKLIETLRLASRALSPAPADTEQFVRAHVGAWAGRRAAKRTSRMVAVIILVILVLAVWQFSR